MIGYGHGSRLFLCLALHDDVTTTLAHLAETVAVENGTHLAAGQNT